MCSIPGLPSPGLEASVLITRVNLKSSHGLLELWVNMDDGKKDIYEQMKEEIQIPQRSFYRSEGKPGDLCVVCIKDKWHRARIVSIHSETYNVFLTDQSQPHATTSEALAWSKTGNFLLPPEIELCILANVIPLQNEWSETASKFLMCLPGKKFKGLVQDVLMPDRIILLEIPIVANYICKLGAAKKIKGDQFKGLMQKCLHAVREDLSESLRLTLEPEPDVPCHFVHCDHYFYPELTIDTFETVYVTEIIDPLNIFCMLFIFSKAVKMLSEQIHQHYEESSDFGPEQPQSCRDPCAARGTDGKWRRSLLKQNIKSSEDAIKDDIEVFYVDEGKTALVKAEDIRSLHGKFLKMPVVTYRCSLNKIKNINGEEAADKTADLKSMLLNQTVVARFGHYNKRQDVYYVTLYSASDTCVNDIFLEKAGPVSFSEPEQDSDVHDNTLFPISLEEKKIIDLLFKAKEVDGFQEETGSGTKIQVGDVCVDDSSTSGNSTHAKRSSVPVLHNNGHPSSSLRSEVQNACDDSAFAVGTTVHVKVSCIESPQKFWCQATESADSFRQLMQDLQAHYAFAHPQPLVESICVARNPENKMWYRASVVARHDTPTVDVRFIDYGQTQSVPLRDVHPIDPVFLQLKAQAFQCCLFISKDPTEPTQDGWNDAEFNEFLKFVDPGASSDTMLKCLVKAVTSDEDGLLVNVVDIQRETESVCELLTQKRAQSKVQEQIPSALCVDGYCYSTLNIEVGEEEKVLVTSANTVGHFYCQLHRNAHVLDKLTQNIAKLLNKPQSLEHTPELNSICLVRHVDKWCRGQIVETSPKLKVHFVDYGDTLAISKSKIYPFPSGSSVARFVPVQAIPLALFDMPADLPQDVNQWFADFAVGHSFTISVVAKSEERKLIVELFDGSLNVNIMVRERVEEMKLAKTCMNQHTENLSNSSKAFLPNRDSSAQEPNGDSVMKTTVQEEDHSWNTHEDAPPQMEQEKVFDGRNPTLGVVSVKETIAETSIRDSPSFLKMTPHSTDVCPERKGKIYRYTWPNVFQNMIVDAHASYIVGPDHFWCQYTNTEDLNIVTQFAEEAGQAHVFPSVELEPGSPCIAFSNNLWYRAQVIQKVDKTLKVLFVDYGNESVIDINKVKPLPYSLLEMPPQAFLCRLNGFIESSGSWDDKVHDEFSKLLVNKSLKVTIVELENDTEIAIPRYTVIAECDEVIINEIMQKYWKSFSGERSLNSVTQTDILPQSIQTESNKTTFASQKNASTSISNVPGMAESQVKMVYTSFIAKPSFFWCQLANTEDLDEVSQLAQEAGQSEQDIIFSKSLSPGSACLALFPSDNQWYRAQVLHKSEETLQVLFVDYGNESEVDVKDVKPLTQSLLEIAPQAFLCCLNRFDESKGSWKDEASDAFNNFVIDKPLKLTVVSMKEHSEIAVPQYSVEIEHEEVNIHAAMLQYWKPVAEESSMTENQQSINSAQAGPDHSDSAHLFVSKTTLMKADTFKDPVISRAQTEMVYASCISEPSFFWCQLANTEDLDEVSQFAQEAGQTEQDTIFSKALGLGSPCLALFPSDNQWYRAQVLHKSEETLHVLFVDYGNESEVDVKDVKPLTQSLLEIAPQAFLCCLSGFDKSKGSWKDEASDAFYNLVIDKPLKLTVVSMKEHSGIAVPQYSVEIEHEEVNIHAAMLQYWKPVTEESSMTENQQSINSAQAGPDHSNSAHLFVSETTLMKADMFKDPVISRAQTKMVYASCISEPSFFWCQLANTEDLDEVSQFAQEAGQTEQDTIFSKALVPGSACLALFPSDNQWYRAQVLHKSEETLHVLFVDYGNESEVDVKDVKPLTQSLLEIAPKAFLCCLSGFDKSKGSWKDEASDAFYNLVIDKPLKLTVVSMKEHSGIAVPQYSVEIEHEEVNIHAAMLQYWKPVTEESSMTENQQSINSAQAGPDHSDSAHLFVTKTTLMKADTFKDPVISRAQTEMVYASCISEPSFFWCQLANTEDLDEVSQHAQEAGQTEQNTIFSKALVPGSPCLALFPSDNQWYRAQVLHKSEETLHVLFVDYGNESEVDVKDVKPLTQSLLEIAPQAFLCCLSGFDKSKGSWKDEASDAFYNLVIDKPLKLTVVSMKEHSEIAVPQYSVQIEHEGEVVNMLMEKYWRAESLETASNPII